MIKKLRRRIVFVSMLIVLILLTALFSGIYTVTKAAHEKEILEMMEAIARQPMRFGRITGRYEDMQLPYFTVEYTYDNQLVAYSGGYYDFTDEEAVADIVSIAINSPETSDIISAYNMCFLKVNENNFNKMIVFADISSYITTFETLLGNMLRWGFAASLVFLAISIYFAHWAVKPTEEAWEKQRKFVGDASHEFKTPLTVITTNAELLQDKDASPEEIEKYSANILTVAGQMKNLVEDMLDLSRADDGRDKEHFTDIDFSKIVNDCLMQFEPVFFENGLQLAENVADRLHVNGSIQRLTQLVNILLDNACKYSAPGETELKLERQGKQAVLTVSNPGEEMSQEQCRQVFERFYRADEARNEKGSYGLGLSIAKSFAEEHGGSISAEGKNGRNSFTVKLPLLS